MKEITQFRAQLDDPAQSFEVYFAKGFEAAGHVPIRPIGQILGFGMRRLSRQVTELELFLLRQELIRAVHGNNFL